MVNKSKQLKIAMFGHKRIPSREGGVEIVVAELATRMVSVGHNVTCFNRLGHHVSGTEFDANRINEYQGVKLKDAFTIDKKGLAAVTSSFFAALKCALGNYDVIHIHAEGPAFMCWLPKLFGKRVVVTVHGLDHQRAKWGRFASWYIMTGEKNAVKYADKIIVLSNGVKKYFLDTYNRETEFIPNGVNKPKIKKAELITEKWGLKKDDYILYLGRLVPEKGIHYLIEAYSHIKTDKKLVIAGGSSDTDAYANKLKEMAAGNENIIFTGFIQGQTLEELYSNAYIYSLPSDLEGMPLSLLEAMSYGNCCLVSDIKECSEVVEDRAICFKKSDVGSLKDNLEKLLIDEQGVAKYKQEASSFICNKYNWDKVVALTLNTYFKNEEGYGEKIKI